MLFTNIVFREGIDISDVVPMLDLDLEECLLNGIVPGDGVIPEYNGIEDTSFIVGRISDNFDAVEHQRSLNRAMNAYRDAKSAETAPISTQSTPTGAE